MKYSQEGYISDRKTQLFMIFAGLALIFWTSWVLSSGWSQLDSITAALNWFGLIVGIIFFLSGRYGRKKSSRFPRYRELILTQGVRSVDQLAPLMGVTPDTARWDVKAMISQKVLLGAQLSKDGEITEVSDTPPSPSETPPAGADIICPGCGAMNESDKEQCAFCGRTLRHE